MGINRKRLGGARKPVHVITDDDLRENGGRYTLMGGAAILLDDIYDELDTRPLEGGPAIAVYPVTEEQIAAGRFKLQGGAALPAYAISTRGIESRVAIPVLLGMGGAGYTGKVLGTNPIAYWPLNETTGTTAVNLVNAAMNGTYARDVSVMGTGAGIGDGNTAPVFNGAADYVNCSSAALTAAFTGAEYMLMAWFRVSAAGVWTDGAARNALSAFADAQNYAYLRKLAGNDTFEFNTRSGNVLRTRSVTPYSPTVWVCAMLSVSESADVLRAYLAGVQVGADVGALGVWAGALGAGYPLIGAQTTAPANPWSGSLAHAAIWCPVPAWATVAPLAVV